MYQEGKNGYQFPHNGKMLKKQYIVFVTSLAGTINKAAAKNANIDEYVKGKLGR